MDLFPLLVASKPVAASIVPGVPTLPVICVPKPLLLTPPSCQLLKIVLLPLLIDGAISRNALLVCGIKRSIVTRPLILAPSFTGAIVPVNGIEEERKVKFPPVFKVPLASVIIPVTTKPLDPIVTLASVPDLLKVKLPIKLLVPPGVIFNVPMLPPEIPPIVKEDDVDPVKVPEPVEAIVPFKIRVPPFIFNMPSVNVTLSSTIKELPACIVSTRPGLFNIRLREEAALVIEMLVPVFMVTLSKLLGRILGFQLLASFQLEVPAPPSQ